MPIEQRRGAVYLAMLASFMVAVDGTIVNLALAELSLSMEATRAELQWVLNAYTLAFAAMMLGAGAITDIFGAKRVFVTGMAVFTLASVACAMAETMTLLNLFRAVQGLGAALVLPSALTLATVSAPDERTRNRFVGLWAAAGGIGVVAGPPLGGLLVSIADWRAVFAVNVLVGIPAIVWSLRSMPTVPRRDRRLDIPGMVAATMMIGGLVFVLIEAPVQGWNAPAVLIAAVLAVVGGVGFVVVERSVRDPLLPVRVYSDGRFGGTAVQGALFNFAFYGLFFSLGLMLQQGRGLDPLASGLLFLPLTGLIAVGNLSSASLTRRFGHRGVLGAGQTLLIASLLATAWASGATSLWPLALALLPVGFASGLLVTTMATRSISTVEPALHGAATAAFNGSRQVGAAIGVAVFGPLLGVGAGLQDGFVLGVLVGSAAIGLCLLITALSGRDREAVIVLRDERRDGGLRISEEPA
ncbi:MFS transporter [Nocardiopsis alba]|uniref:MFS transporter n=1 Tax=Nocardiopsis alba TaxID=53437 RepID=UPI003672C7DF